MKRAAVGGLILTIAVLTGLGAAGALIRFKACKSCEGLVQHFIQKADPVNRPFGLRCPDCADRGKVSLFRSWMRPRVSPDVAALVRGLKDPYYGDSRLALERIVLESGPNYAGFLKGALPNFHYFDGAGFLEGEQKTYLALFSYLGPGIVRESDGITVILLSAEGKALDFIQITWSTAAGPLSATIDDGTAVLVHADEDFTPGVLGTYRLSQWKGGVREGKARKDEVCRFRVRNDRLELIDR